MIPTNNQSKRKQKAKMPEQLPSANWLALQKKISKSSKITSKTPPRKRLKVESVNDEGVGEAGNSSRNNASTSSFPRGHEPQSAHTMAGTYTDKHLLTHGRESLDYLRKMVFGKVEYSEEQKQPGKYLALDCEMVGVGPEGVESSLARVSLVNYHGTVILDELVRQRERVVDYRTAVSGVRAEDMVNAVPFLEIQKRVAELLKDRILVGHAVNNDLKALLLSQPRPLIRDTQLCAGKARLLKTKYPALRKLAQQELGITIQAGEHSSVTDARATMALYRLHRKEWDKGFRTVPSVITSSKSLGKRKALVDDEDGDEAVSQDKLPALKDSKTSGKHKEREAIQGGGRRGVSSGLSTIVKRPGEHKAGGKSATGASSSGEGKGDWWSTLGGVRSSTSEQRGSKGSIRIS